MFIAFLQREHEVLCGIVNARDVRRKLLVVMHRFDVCFLSDDNTKLIFIGRDSGSWILIFISQSVNKHEKNL